MSSVIKLWVIAAALVGTPVLALLIVIGIERTVATGTCELAQMNCKRSFLHGLEYVVQAVEAGRDVVVKPKK